MPPPSPMPALPRLPHAALAAYAGAHFGKSLLWYASELLLIYSLTEHAGLGATAAGLVLALGLLLSAAIGLGAGWGLRRRLRDVNGAGRLQWHGLAVAALALLLVFAAPLLPAPLRLGYVLVVSLLFRLAYAGCDVAQNTLLSLAQWPWRGHDGASALRLAGSGAAALLVSGVVGAVLARGADGGRLALQASAVLAAVATLCAWQLRQALRRATPGAPGDGTATDADLAPSWRAIPWQPVALIAAISLTLPAFTKLAPYVAAYGLLSPGWGSAVLIAYALGTVLVQPLAARWRRQCAPAQRLRWLGMALLLSAPLFALTLPAQPLLSLAAAACIGAIGGSGGQLVWAWHARRTATRALAQRALCFAALTAAAQVALATGVVLIGLLLDALAYRDGDCTLLCWAMAAGPLLCGALCLLLALLNGRRRPLPIDPGMAANASGG